MFPGSIFAIDPSEWYSNSLLTAHRAQSNEDLSDLRSAARTSPARAVMMDMGTGAGVKTTLDTPPSGPSGPSGPAILIIMKETRPSPGGLLTSQSLSR